MPEPDQITLTLPREREFQRVAHLVLGGVALRHELTIEALEDLQLALGAILDRVGPGEDLTVSIVLRDDTIETRVGPLDLRDELERDDDSEGVSLRRLLAAVVDDVAVDGDSIRLTKRVGAHG